jgi:hypothetical protein
MKFFRISPEDTLRGAGLAACRLLVVFESLNTKVTFYGHLSVIIKLHGPKRAGLEAFSRGVFSHPDQSRPDAQVMFLFAGNFAGMAAHAVFFKYYQRGFFHI